MSQPAQDKPEWYGVRRRRPVGPSHARPRPQNLAAAKAARVSKASAAALPRPTVGYLFAVVGVAAASLFIAGLNHFVRVENISLVYLLVVLWLARTSGRGPAIAASLLAFLTYDFFFIPPLYKLTIGDPTEWFSLFALLATALVLGHATAAVQTRAQEAIANARRAIANEQRATASERRAVANERAAIESQREALVSQQRTEALYALVQLIVSTTDTEQLLTAFCERVVAVFAVAGVGASAILLPDEHGQPFVRATSPADGPFSRAFDMHVRDRSASAVWALEHQSVVGLSATASLPGAPSGTAAFFVPLRTRHSVVGVLGIAGDARIRDLVAGLVAGKEDREPSAADGAGEAPSPALFAAFCTQIALALDRIALQQEAIHAEVLRESDRLKDLLLGSVTHDLRTPLAAIEAAADSLLENDVAWSEAERHEFLESIVLSADRLNRLVSNLLDLSRLEAGVARPERKWYPIGDVISTVLDRLELARRIKDRRIELDIPPDLPLVFLDHAQIEQVLVNLLENAVKYSPPQSTIRVQVRVAGEQPELEVRVMDEGIGIPAHELGLIFDRFYRIQHVHLPWAPARPPIGTGLGLAICASIVEAHGGRIWAESEQGKGSTFIFTLPISQDRPQGGLPDFETPREDELLAPAAPGASA